MVFGGASERFLHEKAGSCRLISNTFWKHGWSALQGDCGRVMVVLLTDGRANVSLAKSNRDPDALAEDAPKPSTVCFTVSPWCTVFSSRATCLIAVRSAPMSQRVYPTAMCRHFDSRTRLQLDAAKQAMGCCMQRHVPVCWEMGADTHGGVTVASGGRASLTLHDWVLQEQLKDEVMNMAKKIGAAGVFLRRRHLCLMLVPAHCMVQWRNTPSRFLFGL